MVPQNLTEAKRQYSNRLSEALVKIVLRDFGAVAAEVEETTPQASGRVAEFQRRMREVKTWNRDQIEQRVALVHESIPWIDALLRTIFTVNITLLGSVSSRGGEIHAEMPALPDFIFAVWRATAEEFFYDPELMLDDEDSGQTLARLRNRGRAKEAIAKAVDRSLESIIPFRDIVETYVAPAITPARAAAVAVAPAPAATPPPIQLRAVTAPSPSPAPSRRRESNASAASNRPATRRVTASPAERPARNEAFDEEGELADLD